jgi:glutathione S-transferase
LWSEGLRRFGGPFLAGASFTAVDAYFAPVAFRVQSYGLPLSTQATEYCQRLLATKALTTWYAQALAETLREPGHDEEVAKSGVIEQDLRAD